MKKIFILSFIYFLVISCSNTKLGKYNPESLPEKFSYTIAKDLSNPNLEKNEIYVDISEKLTEGQIATLAEELYNQKDKERRFYIFYQLQDEKNNNVAWATSHFDPELEINIIGSTKIEDENMLKSSKEIDGEILGTYNENEYTFATYTIFKKEGKTFVKTIYKDGSSSDSEVKESKVKDGIRLDEKEPNGSGEYYILKNNILEFYNEKNEMFTTANKLNK